MSQISFFDGSQPFKIKNKIRLIELFAGIGAQAKALERLQDEGLCEFEHYRICEFDKYAVKSYNAVHGTDFQTSDITEITAADLGITETDKYTYILTYSFPCTDLSIAGKQEGMARGSGTRSGLLWEVERLINECDELPQVLVMENVPQVICSDFYEWCEFLESKGYKNYYELMNAKNYGVPQNRNRCFMVSLLGDYYYEFPEPIPLEKRLKDVLEDKVDEKYYLNDKAVKYIANREGKFTQIVGGDTSSTVSTNGKRQPKLDGELCIIRSTPPRKTDKQGDTQGWARLTRQTQLGYSCGAIFTEQGKRLEHLTDVSAALCARDYKGMGNQTATGIIEVTQNDE